MFDGKKPSNDEAARFGVTPLSLGVSTFDDMMFTVIPRNTALPVKMTGMMATEKDRQTSISFEVLQGERALAKDCLKLGSCTVEGIPPAPHGVATIAVTFEIDASGMLKVTSKNIATKKVDEFLIIDNYIGNLTREEIETRIKEAEQMAEEDRKVTERVEAKKELERYIYGIKAAASDHNVNVNWNELDKANLEMALREASEWLDGYGSDPSSSKEDYEKAMQNLTDVWNPIIRKVYV